MPFWESVPFLPPVFLPQRHEFRELFRCQDRPHFQYRIKTLIQHLGLGDSTTPNFGDILLLGDIGGGAVGGGIRGSIQAYSGRQTLYNLIAKTGGISGSANWHNIAVMRREPDPESKTGFKTLIIVSDMANLFHRADFEQNIPLKVNDIIYVPTQPEYVGIAFKHEWDLVLGYLGGIGGYDDFIRRLDNSAHILPRSKPNESGSSGN